MKDGTHGDSKHLTITDSLCVFKVQTLVQTYNHNVCANSIQTELVECPTEQLMSVADNLVTLKVGIISTRCFFFLAYDSYYCLIEQPVEVGPH